MSTPSSASLSQGSSKSTHPSVSSSGRRSSLLGNVASNFKFNVRKKRERPVVDASITDSSHHNQTYNYGSMNVAYGNNVVQNIHTGIDLEMLVFNMERSRNAEYDIVGKTQREPCAPHTGLYVLQQLKTWCKKRADELFYWLTGMPGTGKTTIVYTLCQYLRKRGLLGASFFCSRWYQDCQNIESIFPTIAYQLAMRYPAFRKELAKALHEDPNLTRRNLDVQLKELIIKPFKAAEEELPSDLIVVLDALDECSSGQSRFLQALVDFASQLPFRVVLTSRPEYVIQDALPSKNPSKLTQRFVLREVEEDMVREDIIKYLRHALSSANPPIPATAIDVIAGYAGSSFIIASTIAHSVMDESGDPADRVETVLKSLNAKGKNPITPPLDKLYTNIFSRITDTLVSFPNELEQVKDIPFTIICAHEPLTKRAIAVLWAMSESVVDRRLRLLRSVLSIREDPDKPITMFHVSLPDFITDKTRSDSFYCDITAFHSKLAEACFRTMNTHLRQNICQLNQGTPNEEVAEEVVETCINPGLAYASVYWAHHLQVSGTLCGAGGSGECRTFCSSHLLEWVECLSLLHCLSVCEIALEKLIANVKDKPVVDLLHDFRRFVQLNYDIIGYSATETYSSALIWVPTQSLLRSHYTELWNQATLPKVIRGLPSTWEETSRTIKAHKGQVKSVAIAADGKVTSGSEDRTVRIWNVIAHREERVFTGHQGGVTSVAVSPRTGRIFSASRDKTIRVWDIANPDPCLVFEKHSDIVLCVAVSSDGRLVCSCDFANNVLVWNADTGVVVLSVKSTMNNTGIWQGDARSVNFTLDDSHIFYTSQNTVQVYNLQSGMATRALKGHEGPVESVAVSPSSLQLLTGSCDTTAKLWNLSSGKKTHTLRGHTGSIHSVAFCRDDQRALSGSEDSTIRVWDIGIGNTIAILSGHTQTVWSVAIFPDDLHAISGSADWNMMVWDIPEKTQSSKRGWNFWGGKGGGIPQLTMKAKLAWHNSLELIASSPTLLCLLSETNAYILNSSDLTEKAVLDVGHITDAAFSLQETRLATACKDTISIWDAETGQRVTKLKSSRQQFTCVAFSRNGRHVVTGSDDRVVRVWSAADGKEKNAFQQPGDYVLRVAFSPDDSRVHVILNNKMLCIWNITTSRLERHIKLKFESAPAVFSADGKYLAEWAFGKTFIWDIESGQIVCSYDRYMDWTPLSNGALYSILDSSWICRLTDPSTPPTKICWIPPKYRLVRQERDSGQHLLAFTSVLGDRVLLSNIHGTVVLGFPI